VTRYDLAVIGGGPAGLAAAMYGGMRGMSTAVFEAEAFGGQLINLYPTKPVTNFPAHAEIASRDIALQLAEQAERFGAELYDWSPVEFVGRAGPDFVIRPSGNAAANGNGHGEAHGGDGHAASGRDQAPADDTAHANDGGDGDGHPGEITARTLVLALGMGRFMPRRLGLPDEARFEGKGLSYRLPPIDEITARHVVVVGGGDSALDTALSLRTIAEVTIVHRREAFSAYAFSQKRLAEADIKLVTNGEIVELLGKDHLERVVVARTDGTTVGCPADLLMVSIGQAPELNGIERWELALGDSRLSVSSAMESGTPGLFAAGDYAEYPGKVKMITTAVGEGSTAAASAERYLMSIS
jgi:thioredoxin reductase